MLLRMQWFALMLIAFWTLAAGAAEPLVPFVISYDAPDNVTNVSSWLDAPAGRHGFVRVADGHLATDAGRLRIWGVNLCFDACFPSHEQAERVAARLARFGINCVRMHHMDSHSIWGDSPDHLTIDPKQLERLDYLIYQLKQHGIYTNLNLHVSRWFGPREGFVARQQRPQYDKGLDNFEPRMIQLQRKYARDLLTHTNRYTGRPYTDEPAIAFVEISNEDALLTVWSRGQLDGLPDPYAATFRRLWNAWLRAKYGTTQRLRQAWAAGAQPLGPELLQNGDFTQPPTVAWQMERDDRTEADWSVQRGGPEGSRFLRVVVRRQGRQPWRPQLSQSGFAVKKGRAYTLSCYLRASQPQRIGVNCMMAHAPWQQLGLSRQVDLTDKWQQFRFTFVATRDDDNARITLTGLKPATYDLTRVSLRPGGVTGLADNERLEDDSVAVLAHGQQNRTAAARNDFIDFLWDTERDYWWGMYRFLKDELGVKALVSGTQLSYSPVHVQAALDYIDAHAYWQHPRFPGRPWDRNNWYVLNVPLVNSPGGTLASLACRRVAGRPFTVSEYNHPQPNRYGAEGFPMLSAMAALQDWDGVYAFAYCHNSDFEPERISSYFDIKCDTSKLAHLPACVALFVRGDAAPAGQLLAVPMSRDAERRKLHETQTPWSLTADQFGLDPLLSLVHRVALAVDDGQQGGDVPSRAASKQVLVSDTGQLRWDVSRPGRGVFIADTPRTKLLTGFVSGRSFELGNVALRVGPTQLDWATVSLVCRDGSGFDRPGRVLVAATGVVQNAGARLQSLGGDRVTLGSRWGEGPVQCEVVPVEILLPVPAGRVTLHRLDASGNRTGTAGAEDHHGRALVRLGPGSKTVWYEIEIR